MPSLVCHYVDTSLVDKKALSAFTDAARAETSTDLSTPHVVLRTCQRAEVYALEDSSLRNSKKIMGSLAPFAYTLTEPDEILERLARIAAGAESWLVGEKFVADQVFEAFQELPENSFLAWIGNEAIRIGTKIRQQKNLIAALDYPDVAFDLLREDNARSEEKANDLVIIGGGSMGQNIAMQAAQEGYSTVTLVSRVSKKTRKRSQTAVTTSKLQHMPKQLGSRPFSAILATSELTDAYINELRDFLSQGNCVSVVDLCSSPVFSSLPNTPYTGLSDERFQDKLRQQNERLQENRRAVCTAIHAECQKALNESHVLLSQQAA